MMNRYTLSPDSEELLEKAILLIKAIKRNLVTHDRDARAALGGGKAAESGAHTPRRNALLQSISVQSAIHEMYFRGGTLPYEMVSNRGRVENALFSLTPGAGWVFFSWKSVQIPCLFGHFLQRNRCG